MEPGIWIAMYLPLFVVFFIVIPNEKKYKKDLIVKMKRKRGVNAMTNKILENYKGEKCRISTGSLGTMIVGKIVTVNENWIEIETKKGKELVNADFVQNIKVL